MATDAHELYTKRLFSALAERKPQNQLMPNMAQMTDSHDLQNVIKIAHVQGLAPLNPAQSIGAHIVFII